MSQSALLNMWTIYCKPRDYPTGYLARLWVVGDGNTPMMTTSTILNPDLEELRSVFREQGLCCVPRSVEDDPVVVETWV